MATAYTDYLNQPIGAALFVWQNVWVRLVSNNTGTAYVSDAATNSAGKFTYATKPPGDSYAVFTGPSNTGPWTGTGDTSYALPYVAGDAIAVGSATAQASGPYAATAAAGGADYSAAVRITGGKPWYDPTHPTFGAVGNTQTITNGVMNGTTAVLTSASNLFVAADVGKTITVVGAGTAGANLNTTIASYQNAGQVTLAAVSATVVGAARVNWGNLDTAGVQAACDAARTGNGGTVLTPPGTYLLDCQNSFPSKNSAEAAAIGVGSHTNFLGASRNSTIFLALGNVGTLNRAMFVGWTSNGDTDILFENFTIDGNGAAQSLTSVLDGFEVWLGKRINWSRITAVNFQTTLANEKGAWNCISCSFCSVMDCYVDNGGFRAGGIMFSASENIVFINCAVTGVSGTWRCFICDGSQAIAYLNCFAWGNTSTGNVFDCTSADQVEYVNCVSGGTTLGAFQAFPAPSGFAFSTSIGNTGWGFNLNACSNVTLERCKALNSVSNGGVIILGVITGGIRISGGGNYSNNFSTGIQMNTTSAWQNTIIQGSPTVTGNGGAGNLYSAGPANAISPIPGTVITAPAFPLTTVGWQNPYAIALVAVVTNGTSALTAAMNTTTIAVLAASDTLAIPIPATATFKPTYAAGAPSWALYVQ